ncbi:MAG: M20/M25/M40 family metallo-hydrolase [Peptococcaceae bacterium]|nr:M20/M25/M40 family metallo-hydrolase [Peptococcaceae bacterium]
MINQKRLKEAFLSLVRIDSPSLQEKPVAEWIRQELENIGISCTEDGSSAQTGSNTGNLVACLPGDSSLAPLLLAAHMDTVQPCAQKRAVEVNGRIVSGGDTILGADDLAGIAILLEVCRCLQEQGTSHPPITLLFTTGEEIGLVGAKALKGDMLHADLGYVLDDAGPAGGAICHAPAHVKLNVRIAGKGAHAGVEPEKGVDAIRLFARAVDAMALGRIDEETTANFGIVQGGSAMNAVPAHLEAVGEVRSRDMEKLSRQITHMRRCFENAAKHFGGKVELEQTVLYQAVSLDEQQPVVQKLKKAAEVLNLPFCSKISGGGSDASVLNGLGIPTATLSVGYENMHTTEEYLDLREFFKAAQLVWKLVAE